MLIRTSEDEILIKRQIGEKVYDIQLEDEELDEIYLMIQKEYMEEELYEFMEEKFSPEQVDVITNGLELESKVDNLISQCMKQLEDVEKPVKRAIYENALRKILAEY